jgi:glycosyltransferase involved in cell wall biosynthesis
VLCELFPEATIFTLLHVPGSVSPTIERHRIVTSFAQHLPRVRDRYRHYLPLFPLAVRRLDLEGHDLVISLSHCVAKAVRVPPGALHICHCFTPMRYVWDLYDDYFRRDRGPLTRLAMPPLAAALRAWDRRTSGVHRFIANSHHVADRIRRCYGRDSHVIHSPVDTRRFRVGGGRGEYYLVVSALAPYKRVDLAVRAASRLQRRLLVVGTGQDTARLQRLGGPTVEWLGWRPDEEIAELYAGCRALLFPGVEDFGIVPLEAAAAGRPTIAFGRGGVLETMRPLGGDEAGPPTAVFFDEQTVDGLVDAMVRFEAAEACFDPAGLRVRAEAFDRSIFARRIAAYVDEAVREHGPC